MDDAAAAVESQLAGLSQTTASQFLSRFAALQKEVCTGQTFGTVLISLWLHLRGRNRLQVHIQEFLSKWQSNLVKHEGQLTSMRQTLSHYLHQHEAIEGATDSTALHRLLSDARAHVLAPLQIRMKDFRDTSSETRADAVDRVQSLAAEADTPSGDAKVLFVHSTRRELVVLHCMECHMIL